MSRKQIDLVFVITGLRGSANSVYLILSLRDNSQGFPLLIEEYSCNRGCYKGRTTSYTSLYGALTRPWEALSWKLPWMR